MDVDFGHPSSNVIRTVYHSDVVDWDSLLSRVAANVHQKHTAQFAVIEGCAGPPLSINQLRPGNSLADLSVVSAIIPQWPFLQLSYRSSHNCAQVCEGGTDTGLNPGDFDSVGLC